MARTMLSFLSHSLNFNLPRGGGGPRFASWWLQSQRRQSRSGDADDHPSPTANRRSSSSSAMSTCKLQTAFEVARRMGKRTRARTNNTSPGGAGIVSSLFRGNGKTNGRRNANDSKCDDKATGDLLSDEEVEQLRQAVRDVDANTLGVLQDEILQSFQPLGREVVGYIPIAESVDFTMAVFVLPPGTCIPLHDHPDMYVVSHVLWGQLDVVSFDLVNRPLPQPPFEPWLVTRRTQTTYKQGDVKLLTPVRGNVHSFTAREWTAVFDVLVPPYSERQGRDCTYLCEICDEMSDGNILLEPVECPREFRTALLPRKGLGVEP